MYDSLPADIRDRHPYHMYEEIKLQPEAVAASLRRVAKQGGAVEQTIAAARRVLVTGCGTSWHAAQAGAWMLRHFTRGEVEAWPVQAFELAMYLPAFRPDDVVVAVTHSGATTMTVRALERASDAGADTVLFTGFPDSPAAKHATRVLSTGYGQERSWAHTASYMAAVATFAAIANDLAAGEAKVNLSALPSVVAEALELEEMAHRVAASTILVERYGDPPRIVVTGSGPNAGTAREAVLKLLETSYAEAEALDLEEMLHGPLAAVTAETLLFILAPSGPSIDRADQLAAAVRHIGVVPIVLTDNGSAGRFDDTHRLIMPTVPEALSPLPYVVPLQLFSYFLAIGKGYNPDLLRRDDERYRAARAAYE